MDGCGRIGGSVLSSGSVRLGAASLELDDGMDGVAGEDR